MAKTRRKSLIRDLRGCMGCVTQILSSLTCSEARLRFASYRCNRKADSSVPSAFDVGIRIAKSSCCPRELLALLFRRVVPIMTAIVYFFRRKDRRWPTGSERTPRRHGANTRDGAVSAARAPAASRSPPRSAIITTAQAAHPTELKSRFERVDAMKKTEQAMGAKFGDANEPPTSFLARSGARGSVDVLYVHDGLLVSSTSLNEANLRPELDRAKDRNRTLSAMGSYRRCV